MFSPIFQNQTEFSHFCEILLGCYLIYINRWMFTNALLKISSWEFLFVSSRGLECKSKKSRDTWSNRQIWPWSTERSRAKANRFLPRERTGYSKDPLPTTQEKTTHGHHQMVDTEIRLIILFAAKEGEGLYSQQKQDQELTVAQIMNSLLPNSDWNWKTWGKPLDHSGMT